MKAGDKVRVPWGLQEWLDAEVIEVWGDPAGHVRVALNFDAEDQPLLLLLERSGFEEA